MPSKAHEVMVDIFKDRIKSLYPEAIIRCGELIDPIGLKPDVFVEFSDGKQWVFEMVYKNQNPTKIRDHHNTYQAHGIKDIWILWDDFRPEGAQEIHPNQAVFSKAIETKKLYRLTKPQKTLMELIPSETKYIYTFTTEAIDLPPSMEELLPLTTLNLGVSIYSFDGSMDRNGIRFFGSQAFIPMALIKFDGERSFFYDDEYMQKNQNKFFDSVFLNVENKSMIEAMEVLKEIFFSNEKQKRLTGSFISNVIENATQEEIKEFIDFITSGMVKQIEPITIKGVKEDGTVDFEDVMDNLDVYTSFLTENKFPGLFEKMMGADTEYFQLESVKGTSKFMNSNENYLEFKKQQDGVHNEDLSNGE